MNILPSKSYWLDQRLLNVLHNHTAFSAHVPQSRDEWQEQAQMTRAQLALAAGLIPAPDFPDLEPNLSEPAPWEDITITKVSFFSLPGLLCTGSLYLPQNPKGKIPGILCPYGHWTNGRFHDDDCGSIPKRCAMFAKLGFAVFCYDMLGRCDNSQILHAPPRNLQRLAELYGASQFALQTWNSIRALDFLCQLPQVDPQRIGCTGASGGASQTWTITALDERIKVFAPVCMLSTQFQGGCVCEEGPLLRLNGLTSFDVIASCAPRPVILPSVTQDWTILNPKYEIPALQKVYQLLGAPQNIKNFHADSPHNYNQFTREHIYPWFCHFLLKQPLRNTIPEGNLQCPPIELLQINNPPVEPTVDSTREALDTIQRYSTKDALGFAIERKDFEEEKETKLDTLSLILNNDNDCADIATRITPCPQRDVEQNHVKAMILGRRDVGDVIPALKITTKATPSPDKACLLLAPDGKKAFFEDENLKAVLDAVLARKYAAFTIDCLASGETADMPAKSPRDESEHDFFAFNPSLFSLRVQDVLTTLQMIAEDGFQNITVIAVGEAARIAACAVPLADNVQQAIFDLEQIHDNDDDWMKPLNFQPLIYKIGGLKGALSLIAPRKLSLRLPDGDIAEHLNGLYAALDRKKALVISNESFNTLINNRI